jgi:hypothetical protein
LTIEDLVGSNVQTTQSPPPQKKEDTYSSKPVRQSVNVIEFSGIEDDEDEKDSTPAPTGLAAIFAWIRRLFGMK